MKNKTWLIIILIIVVLGVAAFFFFNTNNNNSKQSKGNESNNSNYEASKSSTNTATQENKNTTQNQSENQNNTENNSKNQTSNVQTHGITENNSQIQPTIKEKQIATFTTKIYTQDAARQNNINITCLSLNETTVKNGETFSFCQTVGQATTSKGYQEADIYDNNGNKKKGLGGGNCQVSTTLYNAVLAVPNLVVTERHEHSNHVPYIQEGKDAAVAYGSYDLKFINKTGNDIRICAQATKQNITVTLIELSLG